MAAGTKNSPSFTLTPTVSWSPEACITVYCILSSGEVISDTARILINQQNYVLLFVALSLYSVTPVTSTDWMLNFLRYVCNCQCLCFPQMSLNWSSREARHGEQVSLSVTTLEPTSQVGIVIMGMHDETPEDDQGVNVKQV